ncbi:UNVERIFIED_CONTAM: Monocarboxylate transporter 9 [Trichonephila clavipes]
MELGDSLGLLLHQLSAVRDYQTFGTSTRVHCGDFRGDQGKSSHTFQCQHFSEKPLRYLKMKKRRDNRKFLNGSGFRGIFVGYFGQKFGLRAVIFTGCILASLGAGLCFFVSDILWMTICWGGIFGIGCGLATCLLPLAINQHFDKHRGKASGISYSGSYIGSFIFPPVVVQLLDKYGLPGTFLVISSTLLNGLAASLLFPSPSSKSIKKNHLESSEDPKEYTLQSSSLPATETENHYRTIWHKILHHFK